MNTFNKKQACPKNSENKDILGTFYNYLCKNITLVVVYKHVLQYIQNIKIKIL